MYIIILLSGDSKTKLYFHSFLVLSYSILIEFKFLSSRQRRSCGNSFRKKYMDVKLYKIEICDSLMHILHIFVKYMHQYDKDRYVFSSFANSSLVKIRREIFNKNTRISTVF